MGFILHRKEDAIRKVHIVQELLRLRKAGKLPPIWIDRDLIRLWIDQVADVKAVVTWPQAERLIAGEPLQAVLGAV